MATRRELAESLHAFTLKDVETIVDMVQLVFKCVGIRELVKARTADDDGSIFAVVGQIPWQDLSSYTRESDQPIVHRFVNMIKRVGKTSVEQLEILLGNMEEEKWRIKRQAKKVLKKAIDKESIPKKRSIKRKIEEEDAPKKAVDDPADHMKVKLNTGANVNKYLKFTSSSDDQMKEEEDRPKDADPKSHLKVDDDAPSKRLQPNKGSNVKKYLKITSSSSSSSSASSDEDDEKEKDQPPPLLPSMPRLS